ncbi:MAG: sulfotransferase family protein [Bacteroidota bacterium]|nr:sulfotransferase family protein [Bacteroidota bacterium]
MLSPLKIISVHVPKTGGVSFRSYLRQRLGHHLRYVYDDSSLKRINLGRTPLLLPWQTAIHGHFFLHPEFLKAHPKARVITWLRDPLERTISHYYYWKNYDLGRESYFAKFKEKDPSLLEFVTDPDFAYVLDTYQFHFRLVKPEQIHFIGRTEYFEEDLARMDRFLFPDDPLTILPDVKDNVGERPEVSDDLRSEIRKHLQDEYEIYHRLLNTHGLL